MPHDPWKQANIDNRQEVLCIKSTGWNEKLKLHCGETGLF